MTALLAVLIISGAVVTVLGAVDAYLGRMKPAFNGTAWVPPKDSPRGLILASIGAAVSLGSGLIGLLA